MPLHRISRILQYIRQSEVRKLALSWGVSSNSFGKHVLKCRCSHPAKAGPSIGWLHEPWVSQPDNQGWAPHRPPPCQLYAVALQHLQSQHRWWTKHHVMPLLGINWMSSDTGYWVACLQGAWAKNLRQASPGQERGRGGGGGGGVGAGGMGIRFQSPNRLEIIAIKPVNQKMGDIRASDLP